jgi:hypothetical protein
MNDLIPVAEIKEMATAAMKSGMFGMPSAEAALTLMLICQSEGIHPMQALKRYHIIKGKPAMRADAMLAEYQRQGGKVEWLERSNEKVAAIFSHESSGSCRFEWTIEMAKAAQLTGNPTWQKFPRQMLTARLVSEAVRTMLPGVVCGIYTPEEIQDFDEPKQVKAKKPSNSTETAQISTPTNEKVVEPAEPKTSDTAPAEMPPIESVTIADKTIGKYKPAPEFTPEDATIIAEPETEIKAADHPARAGKSAVAVANELKHIRELAVTAGCKNAIEIKELYEAIVGRPLEAATSLSDAERENVKNYLLNKIAEKEAANNG